MKMVSLIFLVIYLLQPLACFAHPCDSYLTTPDFANSTDTSEDPSHHHDSDNCETTSCCAVCIIMTHEIKINYSPLVSILVVSERHQKLPTVDLPIFVPPQSIS